MQSSHSGAASVGAMQSLSVVGQSAPSATPVVLARARASRIPEMATQAMLERLPALDDDDEIGEEKEQIVRRDDEPDLKFRGTLVASAAPEFRNQTRWREYRVYRTNGGNYVFSKVGRSVKTDERDKFTAIVWFADADERKRRYYWESLTWQQAATSFFDYDDIAKKLYAKLGIDAAASLD